MPKPICSSMSSAYQAELIRRPEDLLEMHRLALVNDIQHALRCRGERRHPVVNRREIGGVVARTATRLLTSMIGGIGFFSVVLPFFSTGTFSPVARDINDPSAHHPRVPASAALNLLDQFDGIR